ncbi:MAG: N-formylglutamate amidohydrolase [Sphingomonadaceae bacterium]|nr:N-formylglutamate amidohydrolase [Sphingomonadaceae bacterium]
MEGGHSETGSADEAPFVLLGDAGVPALPVLLSVPHAGRDYPAALLAASRLPRTRLELLEDRHANLLVETAVAAGTPAIVATRARAWIDLNRAEAELDAAMIHPRPNGATRSDSSKVLGGLGLIPRRIAGSGEIWAGRIAATDLAERIAAHHRPYHAAIAATLAHIHRAHGIAVLIDCHSMPSLSGENSPPLVVGDRHGRSAARALVDAAGRVAAASNIATALNAPYAGGYTLERHGRPNAGFHALQLEFDRTLYLDAVLREPGEGLDRTAKLLAEIVAAVGATAALMAGPIAAE